MSVSAEQWLPLVAHCYDDFVTARSEWTFPQKGKEVITIARADPGLSHFVYRVATPQGLFACKLCPQDERRRATREWTALQVLHEAGFAFMPQPLLLDESCRLVSLPAVITNWIDGAPLLGHLDLDPPLSALMARFAHLHRITPAATGRELLPAWNLPASFGEPVERCRQRLDLYQSWCRSAALPDTETWYGLDTPAMQDRLARLVAQAGLVAERASQTAGSAPQVLIRAESDLGDALVTPQGQVVLVDWDASGWGDPAFDLAALRCHPQNQGLSVRQWSQMRAAYEPPPDDETFNLRLQTWKALLYCDWSLLTLARLVEAAQRKPQRRGAGIPERLVRGVRQRFDYYLATAEAHLAAS